MNQKNLRNLRKALGFVPSASRDYVTRTVKTVAVPTNH